MACAYVIQKISAKLSLEDDWTLIIAGGLSDPTKAICLRPQGISDMHQLCSNHKEADTRMILHAVMADQVFESAQTAGRIIIRSPDTDVLVLTFHYFSKLKNTEELWIQTGVITSTSDLCRFIAVHSIGHSVSPIFSSILPAVHALTGCDSTSALFRIGKK